MSAALAVQKVIRNRLALDPAVVALVPAANILDRNARPNPTPSIILGEDQEVGESDIARRNVRVYSTLHVWVRETGLTNVKAIAGAIRATIQTQRFQPVDGWHIADSHVRSAVFMRDPDGETAHGVVMVDSFVHEVTP